MKNVLLLSVFILSGFQLFSQKIKEPDFIGESVIVKADSTTVKLEKNTVQIKTKAGATVFIVGIGKIKQKIEIDGCCSKVRVAPGQKVTFIVRAVDNETDPLSVINLFKFEKTSKARKAEVASAGTFSGASENNMDFVDFSAEKYGKSSYLITVETLEAGSEYGLIVRNPNNLDEKSLIVSTFGVD